MFITKEFTIDSAHQLDWHQEKCKNLHGHTYKLAVTLRGGLNKNGVVIDFREIKSIVQTQVIDKLDHRFLNDIIKNPTAENIAIWIWQRLKPHLNLYEIKLYETPDSQVAYRGD